MRQFQLSALALLLLAVCLPAQAEDKAAENKAKLDVERVFYPLETCPVSGNKLASMGKPIELVHRGRLIKVCCAMCKDEVAKNLDRIFTRIDAAYIKAQRPGYPLTSCPISGKPLGANAKEMLHGNRLVRLCCPMCIKAFEKNPAAIMAKLDKALMDKQRPGYALKNCPLSGKSLSGIKQPQEILFHTRLIRFCCKKCVAAFKAKPTNFVSKIAPLLKTPVAKKSTAKKIGKLDSSSKVEKVTPKSGSWTAVLHVEGMT